MISLRSFCLVSSACASIPVILRLTCSSIHKRRIEQRTPLTSLIRKPPTAYVYAPMTDNVTKYSFTREDFLYPWRNTLAYTEKYNTLLFWVRWGPLENHWVWVMGPQLKFIQIHIYIWVLTQGSQKNIHKSFWIIYLAGKEKGLMGDIWV